MKKLLFTLTILTVLFFSYRFMIVSEAAEITDFDPVYYAANNPDVVETFGTDPQILLAHYINCGKAEGRFKNANEEISGILVEPEVIEPEVAAPVSLVGTVFVFDAE